MVIVNTREHIAYSETRDVVARIDADLHENVPGAFIRANVLKQGYGGGDAIRIYSYVRCVRGGVSGEILTGGEIDQFTAPGPVQPGGDTGQPGAAPGQPPQEAIDACNGASAGDACEINAPHGLVTGTCRLIEGLLACVPADGPPEGGN